jgi:hypothetical protein
MYYVFNCIANEHDFVHVLMATLVLGFSIACAQVVFVRILVALLRRGQIIWMIAAGTVMGIGAWATHFIALLGYRPGFAVEFDGWITILSPLITIAGFITTAALLTPGKTASTPAMTLARRLGCAVFATCQWHRPATALGDRSQLERQAVRRLCLGRSLTQGPALSSFGPLLQPGIIRIIQHDLEPRIKVSRRTRLHALAAQAQLGVRV